jgi:hypothetical protein
MFIQYLKDKKWVNLYLDRMRIDIDDIDDKISMASKYHFPPELLELFSNPDTTDNKAAELPTSPNVNMDTPVLSPESSPMPHTRLQSILAVDDSPCVSTREDLHPPQGATDAPFHPSLTTLQSTVFASSSALNVPPVAPNNNITSIQSRIQQDLKLLVIAGVLLIFVDSKEYKQWIRHHMSLITLSEFCQQELEQSLRSLRNNFAPRSHRQMRGYVRLKKQSNSASTPRKVKIYALHSRFSGRSPPHNRRSSPTHLHLIHPALPLNSTLSLEEEKESQKMRALQEQERARRNQKHRERLKRVIFAALSLPVSGGQTLRHLLSTSHWLDAMLQFIHNLPVGIGISSTSALLFHQERAHITAPSQSQAGCLWCQPVREDCPILYVNQEVETVAEVARADIVGYNLGHFLAMQYQERNAPRSQSAPSAASGNVSTRNNTTALPNPSIDTTKISNQREEDGDESSRDPLYASSPYPPLKLDMASAETHKPFSNVDPILHRFRELELDFTVIQKPIYFTYSQKHRDGRRYWHFVKCLPIHRTLLEVLSEYSDGSVSFTNATQTMKSQTVADHRTNGSDDKNSSSPEHVEDSKNKKSGFNVKVDAANWPTVGALDSYETAFAQLSPDGVYHILSSQIIIPDVSIAQPTSHSSSNNNNHHNHHHNNSSNSSSHKNMDTSFESNMVGQIPGQSVTKGRFTPSYTHHLAKDLQVIDDFLFVLSALF